MYLIYNMENLLERISYLMPAVITNNQFSSSYEVFNPLTDDRGAVYVGPNPNGNGNFTGGVIGVKAQSNEVWDMRRSYMVYREYIGGRSLTKTVAEIEDDIVNRWESLPMVSNGVKFNVFVESVNSSLIISDCTQDFTKHATGWVLTDNERESRDIAFGTTSHPVNGLPFAMTNSLNCTLASDFKNFKSIISSIASRKFIKRFIGTNGTTGVHRLVVAPLSLYSALASGKNYLPIGLLSQSSNLGWEARFEMCEDVKNWVIYNPPLLAGYNPTSFFYGIQSPKIVCRFVKIHSAEVLQSLVNDFNFIPRMIPLGETVDEAGNVVREEQSILKSIYFPYNKNIFKRDLLPENIADFTLTHNISEKGIKGVMIRFSYPSVDISPNIDYGVNDINVKIQNLQMSIGDVRIPKIPLNNIADAGLNCYDNGMVRIFGNAGSHLFNPFNKHQDLLAQTSWADTSYLQGPGQPGASNGTFWFSFENIDMTPQESEDTSHSFGLNSFILGNVVTITGTLDPPPVAQVAVHTNYKCMEVLLIGNGQIENVFNKTMVNNVLQVQ